MASPSMGGKISSTPNTVPPKIPAMAELGGSPTVLTELENHVGLRGLRIHWDFI